MLLHPDEMQRVLAALMNLCSLITISMVRDTNTPNSTMMVLMLKFAWIISAYRASISRMLRFSLKFCTAIECPADSSTWPRCCNSAFIGTTKKPANAPTRMSRK